MELGLSVETLEVGECANCDVSLHGLLLRLVGLLDPLMGKSLLGGWSLILISGEEGSDEVLGRI